MRQYPIVAIDGPAGVGKSTVARGVAQQLGYQYIDTGALYRTAARLALDSGIPWTEGDAIAQQITTHMFQFSPGGDLLLDGVSVGESIRTNDIALGASAVARHSEVRSALLTLQRQLGTNGKVVLEGRDVGTVVFPDAEAKFFLSASTEERARRRYLQLQGSGASITFDEVLETQKTRDHQDTNRELSPLHAARDAVRIDCNNRTAAEVIRIICERVNSCRQELSANFF